jgi:CheY-like chemotaxis protein
MSETNGKRILIVDDSKDIVEVLSHRLRKYGTVDSSANGYEALSKILLNDFDVIISDINMPVMDGIYFYKEALKIDPNITNKFLFHSEYVRDDHEIFFMTNNVSFLFKSSNNDDIESSVQKILNESI